ncbi:hypothetical protein BV22DRAFT_66415 [Leucogyrophana mollusca]|uniref:Uncharacterized protein n=1 Tax=Leucogyrophana mollusca TaxID=85980 RepID=A0ACB8BYK3_9AGAM|nr:hypothetical protein BV22DRAFT_66415 [Leucogyrophana mollusca]
MLQTREHIIRECPQYEAHRQVLRGVSREIIMSEVMGTEKGIEALAEFIKESGAFKKRQERRQGDVDADEEI